MTMTQPNSDYTFYFKLVYTEKYCYFSFDPDTTIKQFKTLVRCQSYNNFNMIGLRSIEDMEVIEVIEAGHPNNSGGRDAEMAPKIDYPDTATLRELYEHNWKTTAFYLRGIPNTV
jgi:hypothetical protein